MAFRNRLTGGVVTWCTASALGRWIVMAGWVLVACQLSMSPGAACARTHRSSCGRPFAPLL